MLEPAEFESLRATVRDLLSRVEAIEVKISTPAEEAAKAEAPAKQEEEHAEPAGRRR